MKRHGACFFVLLGLLLYARLPAQDSLDWDIDSIFDEPLPDTPSDVTEDAGFSPMSLVRRRGFTFDASFDFLAGLAPGWDEAPWFSAEDSGFSWGPGVRMKTNFGLDAQISEVFRVKTSINFQIPDFSFNLGDFFFDYTMFDKVFFRGGKYGLSWGISPNFGFTNLLSRVPKDSDPGPSFIFKADVPIGVGGIQALALTRAKLIEGAEVTRRDIGFGGKCNFALRWVDLDIGAFYQEEMPVRAFFSIKTTIGKTELYNEWLAVFDKNQPNEVNGAANLGFIQNFFNDKLIVNGELFLNAEGDTYWYRPETSLQEAGTSSFIEGLNLTLNLMYRFGGIGNPRLFLQTRYAPLQESALLIPGFILSPWSNIELYLALPMGLGSRDGYYYSHTANLNNRPFSVVFLLTLKGSVQAGYYY